MTESKPQTDGQARRRREIIDVAARLFAERGFNGTSMDDIAKELGILKGSLYYWIESKEALLDEVLALSPMLEELAAVEAIMARKIPVRERLRLMVHTHIQAWVRHPHNFRVFVDYIQLEPKDKAAYLRQRDSLESLFKEIIREGVRTGDFEVDETDLSIVVNSIFGILNWFPRWYRTTGPATPDYIADVMANMILNGLASESSHRKA